jgi:hypothetical protein
MQSQTLQENWYTTAADVAAMSKQELQQLKVPVRLWAVLRLLLAGEQQQGSQDAGLAAYDALDAAGSGSNSQTAGAPALQALAGPNGRSAASQQRQRAMQLSFPNDIMQRRMPRNINDQAPARPQEGYVRVRAPAVAAAAVRAPFALKVSECLQAELYASTPAPFAVL